MAMSGHSKWSNIKNRKAAVDKKKSEVFTHGAREIMVAIRRGGGNTDPDANSFLRSAIEKARAMDMPKDNIIRLLKRFEERKANVESLTLEGYGPFEVPILIEVETDSKNRILSEMKVVFRKFGGSLGGSGSVSFLFDRVGEVEISDFDEEKQLKLIDAGVEEFGQGVVWVASDKLTVFIKLARGIGLTVGDWRVVMKIKVPKNLTNEQKQKLSEMVLTLEENEDVVNVFVGI